MSIGIVVADDRSYGNRRLTRAAARGRSRSAGICPKDGPFLPCRWRAE